VIQYGEEYVNNPRLLPSGGIWVNLARAYAQKAGWLMHESGTPEPDGALRQQVIKAIEQAQRLDETWKLQFQLVLRSDHPLKTGPDAEKYKGEDNLEIFETDTEIRVLIGLPPKRRENRAPSEAKHASVPPVPASATPESASAPLSPPSQGVSRRHASSTPPSDS
jgi:hypothetical protein